MKLLHQRLHDAFQKANEALDPTHFKMWLIYCYGMQEGMAAIGRPIKKEDVQGIEEKLESMIKDQWADKGLCLHCGGEIKAHQPSEPVHTTSPPDPIEACVDCGRKAD